MVDGDFSDGNNSMRYAWNEVVLPVGIGLLTPDLGAMNAMKLRKLGIGSMVLFVLVFATEDSGASFTITTVPRHNGNIAAWGEPLSGDSPTFGQVFVDPKGNPTLNSATFYVNNPNASAIPFIAHVYAWNGSAITGKALFTSSTLTVGPTAAGVYTSVSVSTGDTLLDPGKAYIIFYSTFGDSGFLGDATFETAPSSAYSEGKFGYNDSRTLSGLSQKTSPWNPFGNYGNLAFTLEFGDSDEVVAVPEPSSIVLTIPGLLAVIFSIRRHRQSA
jgi:hypothetical protein